MAPDIAKSIKFDSQPQLQSIKKRIPAGSPLLSNAQLIEDESLFGNDDHPDVLANLDAELIKEVTINNDVQNSNDEFMSRLRYHWPKISVYGFLHVAAVYGAYLAITSASWLTILYSVYLYFVCILGITAGTHRLWAHRCYKAKWPLRVILMLFNTVAFQDCVFRWAMDHRIHHKFVDTDADPHNARRGLWYSHMGWLFYHRPAEVSAKERILDLSDLYNDPIIMFQKKYYYTLMMPVFALILPTVIPMYFWGESAKNAFFVAAMLRLCITTNATFTVNSIAHKWGHRSYNKDILPAENAPIALLTLGEGWHNYHHVFPWDYKAGEWGNYTFNLSTAFIDFFAKIGWAYDLKSASKESIESRVKRTGDGTHEVWGWDDKDLKEEDRKHVIFVNKKDE